MLMEVAHKGSQLCKYDRVQHVHISIRSNFLCASLISQRCVRDSHLCFIYILSLTQMFRMRQKRDFFKGVKQREMPSITTIIASLQTYLQMLA